MEPSWSDVDAVLHRLKAVLPARVGQRFAASILMNLVHLRERGARAIDVLAAAQQTLDAYAEREPLGVPFSSSICRAIADAGAPKLSTLSSRVSWARPARGMSEAEHKALADHAAALLPTYGDIDLCIGMAWKNALLFRQALCVGECWSRNDGNPLTDLAAAAADLRLADDVAPVGLVRGVGVVVAVGLFSVDSRAPSVVRAYRYHRFAGDPVVVDVNGGFAGVRALLALWALPITPATLPWIVQAALMPFPASAVVVDVDNIVAEFVGDEARLEDERFQGPLGAQVRARLGVVSTVPTREVLRLVIDGTTLTYRSGGALDVD